MSQPDQVAPPSPLPKFMMGLGALLAFVGALVWHHDRAVALRARASAELTNVMTGGMGNAAHNLPSVWPAGVIVGMLVTIVGGVLLVGGLVAARVLRR